MTPDANLSLRVYRQVDCKLGDRHDAGGWQLQLAQAPKPRATEPVSRFNYDEVDPVLLQRDS